MPNETVSVIIPTFNRAYCLPEAIDSALSQTHSDVEVIVVDDGSTDGTPALMATRYGAEPRVRYVRQANGGVAGARNHGFRVATGAYVALLDSDDFWYPWKLELQLACLRAAPEAGMVWTDMEGINAAGELEFPRFIKVRYSAYRWFKSRDIFKSSRPLREVVPRLSSVVGEHRLYVGDIYSEMIMGSLVHTSTVLIRHERLARVGEFDESLRPLGEDYHFHLRTCGVGPVAFADVASIRYQIGMPDRLTAHRLSLASHSLKTLVEALRDHSDRITLPQWMIRAKLASTYQWVGSEHLEAGSRGPAVRHLAMSLWYSPLQPRTAVLLALACFYPGRVERVRAAFRRTKLAGKSKAMPWALGLTAAVGVVGLVAC